MQKRLVIPEDEPFLFSVYASTREEEMALWGWNEADKLAFLRMQFQMQLQSYERQYPNHVHQLILVEEAQAGRMMTAKTKDALVLVDLSLLPVFRGKGFGTRILQELQQEAFGTSLPIRLHVQSESPAIQLYKRLGFQELGEPSVYVSMEWTPQPV
ncbi:GNAT family N-acetyltransferase [Brevibacillus migulae]|uniref:GNAT family N-acetyltransferase n=1 Tax=Brevibacillus migulae TaxID=1644114 RepID=UPI00106E7DA9|nr:GNAT family N-acetyltransferase [Brevibacillus migulae]